jgi:hypothetical protein
MEYYVHNGELYHHGILGMKWGVRRYQNKDGSLTPAGKKRDLKKKRKNLEKARAAKAERQKLLKEGKLPASKMTDTELAAKVRRLEVEKRYKDLVKETSPVNKGREFVKKYGAEAANKILWENAVDIGKQVAKHYGVEFANKKIGKMKKEKDPDTGEMIEVLEEVIFANNKKKS